MSSMLVKLDENLGQSHAELVRQSGHSADRVTDEGLSGAIDPVVWQRVVAEGRFFITLDLDFADVRRFAPGTHPGLLLIRPGSKSRKAVAEILVRVLRDYPLVTLRGCFVVADSMHTRIRRPSPPDASD